MRSKPTSRAKIVHLRRRVPENLVFERLELEPLLAIFRVREPQGEYIFSLDTSLDLCDLYVRVHGITENAPPGAEDRLTAYLPAARDMAKDQLKTWEGLTASERISILITWAEEDLDRAEAELGELVGRDNPRKYTEYIILLAKDIEALDHHLGGLETAWLALS